MMKKVLLLSVLVSGLLFADGIEKAGQMKTMQSLEAAMGEIQKGFLYNNESIVETAVNDLQKALIDVNSFVIAVDSKEQKEDFNPKKYASTEASAINKESGEILDLYKAGKKDEAREAYNVVLNRCIVCHKIIRKW